MAKAFAEHGKGDPLRSNLRSMKLKHLRTINQYAGAATPKAAGSTSKPNQTTRRHKRTLRANHWPAIHARNAHRNIHAAASHSSANRAKPLRLGLPRPLQQRNAEPHNEATRPATWQTSLMEGVVVHGSEDGCPEAPNAAPTLHPAPHADKHMTDRKL